VSAILITGGSTGIGRELVQQLIAKENRVWAVARTESKLQQLGNELNSKDFFYSVCDVGEANDWLALKNQLEQQSFSPDILILNAGVTSNSSSENNRTNYQGVVNGFSAFKSTLQKQGGVLVVSGSLFGLVEAPFNRSYSQSKKDALEFLMQQAKEPDNRKIAFQYFVLGPVATGINGNNAIPFWKGLFIPGAAQTAAYMIRHLGDSRFLHAFPFSSKALLLINRLLPKSLMDGLVTFLKR
jgi:short-subunit dehydrogenase